MVKVQIELRDASLPVLHHMQKILSTYHNPWDVRSLPPEIWEMKEIINSLIRAVEEIERVKRYG